MRTPLGTPVLITLHHSVVQSRRAERFLWTIDEMYLLRGPGKPGFKWYRYDKCFYFMYIWWLSASTWAHPVEAAVLAVCEEFAFVSLPLNPGLTHAILISLLKDNHDPKRERDRDRKGSKYTLRLMPHTHTHTQYEQISFLSFCTSWWMSNH